MRGISNIFLAAIIFISAASCFEIETTINVTGGGYLYSNSNVPSASDHIDAYGDQKYHRYYLESDSRSLFSTSYNFNDSGDAFFSPHYPTKWTLPKGYEFLFDPLPRTYSVSSSLPGGLTHFMKLNSKTTMNTINYMDIDRAKGVSTQYKAVTDGQLQEGVFNKSSVGHPKFISELEAVGEIRFNSSVKTNETPMLDNSLQTLLASLDKVQLPGEMAHIDVPTKTTVVRFSDGKEVIAKEAANEDIPIDENTVLKRNDKPSIDQGNANYLEKIKESDASTYKDYGDYRLIYGSKEYLAITSYKSNPIGGDIGTNVKFTIKLYKEGNKPIKDVSVIAAIPPEMDFLNFNGTSKGIFSNGNAIWSNEGLFNSQGDINLSFDVRINEEAKGKKDLNSTAYIYDNSNGREIDRQIATFTVSQTANEIPATQFDENNQEKLENDSIEGNSSSEKAMTAIIPEEGKNLLRIMGVPEGGIDLTGTADNSTASLGNEITYDISVKNVGNTNLTNLNVSMMLPQQMELDVADPPYTTASKNKYIWTNLGDLSPGKSKPLIIIAKVVRIGDVLESKIHAEALANGSPVNDNETIDVIYKGLANVVASGDYLLITQKERGYAKRTPLVRKPVFLGKSLIWDRRANVGWKSLYPQYPYFITDASQINESKLSRKTLRIN